MGTTLQDVIVPELFNPYVVNRTMELSALFNSGIVTNNSEFDTLASQAAPTVNMPFFEDLTGESEQVIEGADLTADKISSNKDVAAIIRRAKMWSATDLSAALAGADPMKAIGDLVAGFWARDMQKELVAILDDGYTFADLEGQICDAVKKYLAELAKEWENSKKLVVRISAIESRLLDISGVIDIGGTTLNGSAENLTLGEDEIPVFGTVGELDG